MPRDPLQPDELRLPAGKAALVVRWGDDTATLPAEFLRVESPSAEVKGHGPGQARLVSGKRGVTIAGLEPMGAYAVKITFSDGHASGLYTWALLKRLADEQESLWQAYLDDMDRAGLSRDRTGAAVLRKGLGAGVALVLGLAAFSAYAAPLAAVPTPAPMLLLVENAHVPQARAGEDVAVTMSLANPTSQTITLTGAATPFADHTLLQRYAKTDTGLVQMQTLNAVAIEPHKQVLFVPGALELRLLQVTTALQTGLEVPLTLRFADGTLRTVRVDIR